MQKGKSWQDKVILWQKWGRNFELMTLFFQNGDPCILIANVLCLWATSREQFYSDYICLLNMESTKSVETDTYLSFLLLAVISEFLQKYLISWHCYLSFVATIWIWNVLNEYAKLTYHINQRKKYRDSSFD